MKKKKDQLEKDLMKMPDLESELDQEINELSSDLTGMVREHYEESYYLQKKGQEIYKSLHDLNTSHTHNGETTLRGRDEMGEDFVLTIPTVELLHWLDISYLKQKAKEYIDEL